MTFFRTALAAAVLVTLAAPVQAAQERKFEAAAFAAAQAEGRPILVDVSAWWCPVCASQKSTIKQVAASPAYAKLIIFKVDYDGQKPVWRGFGVLKQGTLIAFRGKQEVGRLAFETDKAKIANLLAAAVR